jgi:hypothetical protein
VRDYFSEDHLARFVVDIVEQLDESQLSAVYSGRGSMPFHPALLVALLFYGYATGVFSSRKLEKATYDSIADNGSVPANLPIRIKEMAKFPKLWPLKIIQNKSM